MYNHYFKAIIIKLKLKAYTNGSDLQFELFIETQIFITKLLVLHLGIAQLLLSCCAGAWRQEKDEQGIAHAKLAQISSLILACQRDVIARAAAPAQPYFRCHSADNGG